MDTNTISDPDSHLKIESKEKQDFSEYLKHTLDQLEECKKDALKLNNEETTNKIIEFVRKTIHLEITNNMKKIYNHLKEPYEDFIKSLHIDVNDYSIHVVFTRHPTNDEMARVYSSFVATPFNFNTCFKVIEGEGEGLKITNFKINLS
jgi:sugar-specific transcriptional regulator TrmB